MKKTAIWIMLVMGMSGCVFHHTKPIDNAVAAEHAGVNAIHIVIGVEEQTFLDGGYSVEKHQTYVAYLKRIVQGEKALNDALMVWDQASGQPMPIVVQLAVENLTKILNDVQPLIADHPAVENLYNQLLNALNKLGVK